jgi:hypothetical protein
MSTNQLKAQREPLITALREIRDAATAAGRRRLLPLARTLWAISGVPDRRWRFVSHALPITTDRTRSCAIMGKLCGTAQREGTARRGLADRLHVRTGRQ